MKKKYLIPVLLLLAACGQNEWPDGLWPGYTGVITFSSPYEADTRAALRSGSFEAGDKVGVLGYCVAKSSQGVDYSTSPWDTKKDFCTPDIFYNQELTYDGTGSWNYAWNEIGNISGLHPWEENESYTYSFFAYYPYADDNGTITVENKNMGTVKLSDRDQRSDPTIIYTMPHMGNSTSFSLDWSAVPDFMLAYNIDHKKSDGVVSLEFRHLFSAFAFRVNNYNTYPVYISNLSVSGSGFYKSVTVTGQESGYTVGTDRYSGQFMLIGNNSGETFECPGAEEKGGQLVPTSRVITDENNEEIVLLFIPNANDKLTDDNNGSFNLTLQATEQNGDMIGSTRNMGLKDSSFRPGMRTVFNINIVGNDFIIQARSEDAWEDGGDSDIVFE